MPNCIFDIMQMRMCFLIAGQMDAPSKMHLPAIWGVCTSRAEWIKVEDMLTQGDLHLRKLLEELLVVQVCVEVPAGEHHISAICLDSSKQYAASHASIGHTSIRFWT